VKTEALVLVALPIVVALAANVRADAIPYPTPGVLNPVVYTFTATNTGKVSAYFAGSTASYVNELGMLVNGLDTGIYGLNNHTSALGLKLDFGIVTAGDTLTFVLWNHTLGGIKAYSDPALNGPYDSYYAPLPGVNHVYSTPYTATSPIIDSIPVGTFVSFEDLPASGWSDLNYNDEDFVFTNVSTVVPLPAAAWTGLTLLAGIAGFRLIRRRQVA